MARFYEDGVEPNKEFYFDTELGDAPIRLGNDNYYAVLHEVMDEGWEIESTADAVYDRVAIEDPTDNKWWTFWRYNIGDEQFTKLEYIARRCGTLLIRQTALQNTVEDFNQEHKFTDTDFDELLGGADG